MKPLGLERVAIVGGGVIGLASAWQLARAGHEVTLLERNHCGSGASGVPYAALWPSAATKRGTGHIAYRASLWQFESFVRELSEWTGDPIEFGRPGRIEMFASEDRRRTAEQEVVAACRDWPNFGNGPVQEMLSPSQLEDVEPGLQSSGFGGLLCRVSAYVNARQLVATLRHACFKQGVAIHEDCEVTDLLVDGGRIRGVVTWEGPVRADAVLVAAGAWTSQISVELRPTQVAPVQGEVILLRPKRAAIDHLVKQRRTYLIPTASGEVLVGATTDPEAGFDCHPTDAARRELFRSAVALVPSLENAEVVDHWAGLRPEPLDHFAKVGPVAGVPGLLVAAGHFKTGVAMAPGASRQVLDAIQATRP